MTKVNIRITGNMSGEWTSNDYAKLLAKLQLLAQEYGLQVVEEE